jgi:hypothetical protein
MKLYLLVVVSLMVLVVGVQGLSVDFQNPSDFSAQITCEHAWGGHGCEYAQNTTGGNSAVSAATDYIISQTPLLMTYSAASFPKDMGDPSYFSGVFLADSNKNDLYHNLVIPNSKRVEVKMIGGQAYIYADGVFVSNSTYINNPAYVAWVGAKVDDIIWGSTSPQYIFGMPQKGYFLMKDVLNPAASGFYRSNQTDPNGTPTLMSSNSFASTFGKNNGNNETVTLSSPTGGTQLTYYTGTAYAGTIQWDLTKLTCSNCTAPYGLYSTTINPQTNSPGFATSDWLPYIGSGANIVWDKQSYAVGETATITVTVSDSYYTQLSNYNITIQDAFGNNVNSDTSLVFTQPLGGSGDWITTSTYTWVDTDVEGAYYALIYGDYNGERILMNYATASLSSTLVVEGYVKDAETTNAISGALVNVTQASTTDHLTSGVDGNYTTTSDFTANAPTTIVVSKSGYETYQHVFTPLYAGTIQINLTLMPTSPTYTGIALGGIVRTPPYNRTIDSALVTIRNGTTTYTATTNSAGYYIKDSMFNGSVWDIWGNKIGYSNSTIYQKLVVGI